MVQCLGQDKGLRFAPWLGNEDQHAAWWAKKRKETWVGLSYFVK